MTYVDRPVAEADLELVLKDAVLYGLRCANADRSWTGIVCVVGGCDRIHVFNAF